MYERHSHQYKKEFWSGQNKVSHGSHIYQKTLIELSYRTMKLTHSLLTTGWVKSGLNKVCSNESHSVFGGVFFDQLSVKIKETHYKIQNTELKKYFFKPHFM